MGGLISVLIQLRMARRDLQRKDRREEQDRLLQAEKIRSRYRNPLLASAWALQSRIYNIVGKNLFSQPAENQPRPNGRSYAIESTLYVIAEFLGWIEILRREIQFLDLGDDEETKKINEVLYRIRDMIAHNDSRFGAAFRLFRIEQRAIGELMIEPVSVGATTRFQCIGPAAFSERLEDQAFQRWFITLEQGIGELSTPITGALVRLALIQNWILVFMNLIDPNAVKLPGSRIFLPVPTEFSELTPATRLANNGS